MKKSLLLASMAALSMTAFGQAKDPATYAPTSGYQLESLWMMSVGNGENGVATSAWMDLEAKMGNAAKGTTATICGDYIYVACSTKFVPGIDETTGLPTDLLTNQGHLLVLDKNTGAFVKDLALTLNGEPLDDLLCANHVGHDDFGHVWICGYRGTIYNADEYKSNPMNLYMVDTETGALTLVQAFEIGDIEGAIAGQRVDYFDVIGNLAGDEEGAAFLAVPNEVSRVIVWVKYPETDYWDLMESGSNIIDCKETYPAGQTAWNYSPMGSFVRTDDGSFEGAFVWVDGHTTNPALYDQSGELLSSFKEHAGDAPSTEEPEGGPWANYLPERQPNGMRQFGLGNDQFLAYAIAFPDDSNMGGHMGIVKLDQDWTLAEGEPMWTAPAAKLGIRKGEGRFSHAIDVTDEYTDANGKKARDLMVFKDKNGIALYRIAEAGFDGIDDITLDNTTEGPAEYFNLNGVRVAGELTPGLYIMRQGTTASKVIIK